MAEVAENVGVRRFTIEEYHRMGKAGVFAPGERVELIRGVIRELTPKGRRHIVAVSRLVSLFPVRLAGRASFLVQDPLKKSGWHSEPEPDFVVTSNPDPDTYGTEQSPPLLVVEVSDTSLDYDRTVKVSLYAEGGVPEYWIINLVDNCLEVHRNPSAGIYQHKSVLQPGERIAPEAWPEIEIDVADLIPSATETEK